MAKITGLIMRGGKFSLRLYVPKDLIGSFDENCYDNSMVEMIS